MKSIKLDNLKIPITEYASQGNAILGIRDSGKSYSSPVSPLSPSTPSGSGNTSVFPEREPGILLLWLQVIINAYPDKMDREYVARASGQSPTSSGYTNNLGKLRSLGVIDYPDAKSVIALPILFLE